MLGVSATMTVMLLQPEISMSTSILLITLLDLSLLSLNVIHCFVVINCFWANNIIPHYVNFALNQQSRIDYILASPGCNISSFSVIDPDINFSDRVPLLAVTECAIPFQNANNTVKP